MMKITWVSGFTVMKSLKSSLEVAWIGGIVLDSVSQLGESTLTRASLEFLGLVSIREDYEASDKGITSINLRNLEFSVKSMWLHAYFAWSVVVDDGVLLYKWVYGWIILIRISIWVLIQLDSRIFKDKWYNLDFV